MREKFIYVIIRTDYIDGRMFYKDFKDCYSNNKKATKALESTYEEWLDIHSKKDNFIANKLYDNSIEYEQLMEDGRIFMCKLTIERRRLDWDLK